MRSLAGQNNHVALNMEEQQWLLWSLTPVALRHLLCVGAKCDMIPLAKIMISEAIST
jgi:hypothetical protein